MSSFGHDQSPPAQTAGWPPCNSLDNIKTDEGNIPAVIVSDWHVENLANRGAGGEAHGYLEDVSDGRNGRAGLIALNSVVESPRQVTAEACPTFSRALDEDSAGVAVIADVDEYHRGFGSQAIAGHSDHGRDAVDAADDDVIAGQVLLMNPLLERQIITAK